MTAHTLRLDQGTHLPGSVVEFVFFDSGVLMIRVDGEDRIALTAGETIDLARWLPKVIGS